MKIFSIVLLVALVIFVPLSFLIHPDAPRDTHITKADLEKLLPKNPMGWAAEDVPLGASEAVSESALKTLNLDEFVQKKYTWRNSEITVFISYWRPGKMDTRFVMIHTPDICWVGNGWKKEEFRDSSGIPLDGFDFAPVQYRIFSINGHRETVYFWLFVNGRIYDYSKKTNIYPNPWPFMRDFFKEMKNGKPEHLFIRISSNLPENRLIQDPLFAEILRSLESAGVCTEKKAAGHDSL